MSEFLMEWLGRAGYLPHGYCFTWSPGLLWSMVSADAVIAASYYSIPVVLLQFARRRPDVRFKGMLLLFSAFIFACGTTHLLGIWTIWQPDYAVHALVKVLTAAVSLVTAVALWPLLPRALKIPSARHLQGVIDSLEAEASKRRTVEEHLSDVQQSLAVTLASIGAGFFTTDRLGRVVHMNEVAERTTGWTLQEAAGRSVWEVFVREGRPAHYLASNPVDLMIEQNITLETVHHVTCIARGGARTVLEVKSALTHATDGAVRGIAVVFRDLTRLLQAEAETNRLAAIVESSYDAIVGKTLEGRITYWNHAAETLFGYTAAEAIGQPIEMLIPHERAAEETRIRESVKRGERIFPFETVRLAKGGRRIDVSITVSPIRDTEGRIVGASKIARDVTQQRLAEQARLKAQALEIENRQIQEASRLKSEFLANMSHELRTPMNAIIGFADLLASNKVPQDSPKRQVFVDHIRSSGRHLLQLINDILDLSKVESGKFEFFPEPVDPGRLANEVINVLHGEAVAKSIRIEAQIDPALDDLVIDAQRLKQVLFNYLSNALKFTPAGGRVAVRVQAEGTRWWRLEVEDTGIGIEPQDIPKLFTEFQQLDGSLARQHQGTGLGLALTRRLVELQGGTVGVRSTPGVGTVFHARLPRQANEEAGLSHPIDLIEAGRVGAAADGGRSVLVIEDDPRDGERLVGALEGAGFEVALARTAAEALALSRVRAFSAITLDLILPDQPGLDVLAEISRDGPNREVPVLVITVLRHPLPPIAFSVADVLHKPVDGPAVIGALHRNGVVARDSNVVVVVDDDRQSRELMTSVLASASYAASAYARADEALAALDTLRPAAVILDLGMQGIDGFEMLDRLHAAPQWRSLPVFVWTSRDLSAADYARLDGKAQTVFAKAGMDIDVLLGHIRARLSEG